MVPPRDQTYYELLEIAPQASREEVQVAYNRSRSAFSQNSLAIYSLFSPEECAVMQQRIEEAYRTLMNEEARRRYDESIGLPSGRPPRPSPARNARPSQGYDPTSSATVGLRAPAPPLPPPAKGPAPPPPEGGVVTGAYLRKVRESRGIDLREIATTTRVGLTYLQFIEEENFQQLPVPAYLRGFLKAYARHVGLDPDHVSREYLKLYTLYHEIKGEM